MSENRVIAVSMATKTAPLMALASSTSNAFHVHSVEALPTSATALAAKMAELEQKAKELGAEFVVEDPTGLFSSFGRPLKLNDKDNMARPVLVAAMEKYTSLKTLQAITYPPQNQSALNIPKTLYNLKHSDNGSVGYEIDWDSLRDEQRVFLLAIHTAMCQGVYQADFLAKMFCFVERSHDQVSSPASEVSPSIGVTGGNGGRSYVL
jgi:hypothetical protein